MSTRTTAAALALAAAVTAFVSREGSAHAQACCVGASGLTPGWLANHEQALVGAQLRLSQTHGTYPVSGAFYVPSPGRDTRIETSLFGSIRILPRFQASVLVPIVTTRRRAGSTLETRTSFGDLSVVSRYDVLRTGESQLPGIAILAGFQAPTGTPPDRGTGLLGADVTGIGAWEFDAGLMLEKVFHHVIVHATALAGLRTPRDVVGVTQSLGPRALYLVAGGWVFDDDAAILASVTHSSDGDATLDGVDAPGTGFRVTQLALLVVTPLSDTFRLRTSVFTDVPPFGSNHPALGGTSISLSKSWY